MLWSRLVVLSVVLMLLMGLAGTPGSLENFQNRLAIPMPRRSQIQDVGGRGGRIVRVDHFGEDNA